MIPPMIHGAAKAKSLGRIEARLPMSQYVITGSVLLGSATSFKNDTAAVNRELIIIPASTRPSVWLYFTRLLIRQTAPTADSPRTNARNDTPW